jgi:hypothetical protein
MLVVPESIYDISVQCLKFRKYKILTDQHLPTIRLRGVGADGVPAGFHYPIIPVTDRHIGDWRAESRLVNVAKIVRALLLIIKVGSKETVCQLRVRILYKCHLWIRMVPPEKAQEPAVFSTNFLGVRIFKI